MSRPAKRSRRLTLDVLEPRVVPTGSPVLVADIQPGAGGSYPAGFAAMGGKIYFAAFTASTGSELFRSDGTAAGTSLVADIYPGTGGLGQANSSNPSNLTTVGNAVFFTANDGVHGVELWKTDGTTAGTVMVKDIQLGANSSSPTMLAAVGNTLYFVATDATHGTELWKSDGTTAGTVLVADLNPGSASTQFGWLCSDDGRLFFTQGSGFSSKVLEMTDPSGNTITQIANAADPSTSPFVIGTRLFYATNIDPTTTLNVVDAANANPVPLTVLSIPDEGLGSTSVANFANVRGNLFFSAYLSATGTEPWISDGTADGTHLIDDINQDTSTNDPGSNPTDFTDVGGVAYFSATTIAFGTELWRSDGTGAGTYQVTDLVLGNGSSDPLDLVSLDGRLLFTPQSPSPITLREYDPVSGQITAFPGFAMATTSLSTSIVPSIVYNDVLYMRQDPSNSIGSELYKLEFDPNAPVIAGFSPDSGTQGDGITNANVIQISGAATPGNRVQVSDNGNPIGTPVTADAGGNWLFTTPTLADGTHAFTAAAVDLSGNTSAASNTLTVTVDTAPPAVTVNQAGGQADPTNLGPISFAVHFSEPVTGFTAAGVDLSASTVGGTLVPNVTGSGADYTVTVSGMTGVGTVTASVSAGAATDIAGNASLASTSSDNSVTFDDVPPAVAIDQAPAQPDPTNGSIAFAVHFNEPVIGFSATGVDLSASTVGGTLVPAITGTGADYTVTVTGMDGVGTVTASLFAAAATDLAGNPSEASTSTDNSVAFDNVPPTVTIDEAAGQPDPTNSGPVTFTAHFSEPVTGLTAAGIDLSASTVGGSLSAAVTGSGQDYTVIVSGMAGAGSVVASVKAGAAADTAGNGNTASTSSDNSVLFDNVAPSVTINQAIGQADPTAVSPVSFAVRFSEPVTGFSAAGVDLSASTVGGNLTAAVTGSGQDYTVTVTGVSGTGLVVAAVRAGAAADPAGNLSEASTSSDDSVLFDTIGVLQFGAPMYSVDENGGAVDVVVTRTAGTANALTVQYATADGTAAGGVDYAPTSGTLTWANGDAGAKTITIPIVDDGPKDDSAFSVQLSNPTGGAALGTPAAATVQIEGEAGLSLGAAAYAVAQADGFATITVHRLNGQHGAVSVNYATADATAVAGRDYSAVSGMLAWADGDTADKTFTVPMLDDGESHGRETVLLSLTGATGNSVVGPQGTAVLTIAPNHGTTITASAKKPVSTFSENGSPTGDQVAISLGGKIGTLIYYLTDGVGPISEIDLSGTDPTKSTVTITVKKPKGGTGDGRVQVGEVDQVDGSGLKSLSMAGADLVGAGIHMNGFVGSLKVGNVTNGAAIVLSGPAPAKPKAAAVKVAAAVIGDGTDIDVAAPLGSLTAVAIGRGTIEAPSVGSITVTGQKPTKTRPAIAGDFASDLTIAGTGLASATVPALKSLKVVGTVDGSTIQVGGLAGTVGDVGGIRAGAFQNARLFAGYTGPDPGGSGAGSFNLASTVKSFTVTGPSDAFANSYVVATTIKSATLASVKPDNGGTAFGLYAHQLVGHVLVNLPERLTYPGTDHLGDFDIKII